MNNASTPSGKLRDIALNKASKFLGYRARTVFELTSYLRKKGTDADIIRDIIAYLTDKNYLDDLRFSRERLEYLSQYKPRSCFALRYELKKNGVPDHIIDEAVSGYDDERLALTAARKRVGQWKGLDKADFKKKVMNFLRYRGFNYQTCMSVLSTVENDEDQSI